MPLSDEIAVLDGVDIPSFYSTRDVLDASAGANYSGGSSYAPGLPLLPSNAGLADLPDYYASRDVLDASAGANYSGGSSYAPGLPLLPSNAGLAGLGALPVKIDEKPITMDALELQRLFAAAGVRLTPDGVWGKGSLKSVIDWIVGNGLDERGDVERDLPRNIVPYAKGRRVIVLPRIVSAILKEINKKVEKGEALAGIPDYYTSVGVLDASAGANYSGGSSYAPGLPLLPSNAGLADADEDLAAYYGIQAGVLRPQRNVLDASQGANYSGGSSYAPGLPLLPSNAGLAESYDGKPLDRMDDYWGSTMGVMQNAYSTGDVLDASDGANYSGGSSYAPGLPLLPSNAGLAGLDAVSDKAFKPMLRTPGLRQAFNRMASRQSLNNTKVKFNRLQAMSQRPMPRETYDRVKMALIKCRQELDAKRKMRANILKTVGLPTVLTPKQRALAVARRALGARA